MILTAPILHFAELNKSKTLSLLNRAHPSSDGPCCPLHLFQVEFIFLKHNKLKSNLKSPVALYDAINRFTRLERPFVQSTSFKSHLAPSQENCSHRIINVGKDL